MGKVEQMFNATNNIPSEFRNDFAEFLKLYREWVEKEDNKEFGKYLNALLTYAEYAVAHHYPLGETHEKEKSVVHKVADALAPQKGVVAFPEKPA
jgi:hypothetical protein